jgi:hypothetical protein
MSAEIIQLADMRPIDSVGNGAREALIEVMGKVPARCLGDWDAPACTDYILALMWERGFKVAPLEPTDEV